MHNESTMRLWPEGWLTDHGVEGEALLSREVNTMELLTNRGFVAVVDAIAVVMNITSTTTYLVSY
jgi:hypothetical protein